MIREYSRFRPHECVCLFRDYLSAKDLGCPREELVNISMTKQKESD